MGLKSHNCISAWELHTVSTSENHPVGTGVIVGKDSVGFQGKLMVSLEQAPWTLNAPSNLVCSIDPLEHWALGEWGLQRKSLPALWEERTIKMAGRG